MKTRQAGFTLVEIAIVLVIIGLLLGGVLKGQELINSAKSKAVINDFRNTATMIAAYQDRFRALPGDHKSADKLLSGLAAADVGDQDGLIEGDWKVAETSTQVDTALIWLHLRKANLAPGTTPLTGDWTPKNTEGGQIGVQSTAPHAGMSGRLFVCQDNISGRIAQQVDTTMDDGKANDGSVRFGTYVPGSSGGGSTITPPTTSPVPETDLYVMCAAF